MKKYVETLFNPFKFDSLGTLKNADSSQLDKFLDDIAGFPSAKSNFTIDNFGNSPKFINLPPFFVNTLVIDKFRTPNSNVSTKYIYLHPDFAFLKTIVKNSELPLITSSFRPFQNKPTFLESQLESASLDPDRLTTGRFLGGFFRKIFFTPPPAPAILPNNLNASILADNAYLRALSSSVNNSPFSIVSFDEFFYLLSGFDKTAPYQLSQYQVSNLDYYKTILKINYIFYSNRHFVSLNRSEIRIEPIQIWYENLFLSHFAKLLDAYFFNKIRPEYHRNIKRKLSFSVNKYSNSFSTELYPIYSLPQSFRNSFQYISSPIYSHQTNNFDYSVQKKLPIFFDHSNSRSVVPKPNLFNLNFSEIYFYSWDFKLNRFVDSRTKFQKVSNFTKTDNFRRYKELPIEIHKTNLEGDDLDRFFFSAYKSAKFSKSAMMADSSTLLHNSLRWLTFDSPNFNIYKNFTPVQSDFLNTFEFFTPFSKTSEAQLFKFDGSRVSLNASSTFLRRYYHPFASISARPHLRSLFQPSPRFKRFISFKNKFKKSQVYPRGRRRKGSFFKDQTFLSNQNDFYFYFFDPSISFNKEYSSYFLPKKSFKIANSNFFDYIYTRRRLPFRKKYKLFDRIEKKDFIFQSRLRAHKSSQPSTHLRTRGRKINRYRYSKTDLFLKEKRHLAPSLYKDPKIEVGPSWEASYHWLYPFYVLAVSVNQFFLTFFRAPYRFFTSLLLNTDGFFSVLAYSFAFFFSDYILLTIYVYFPGLLFLFDYAFFSFHFHIFHFWVIFFSFFFVFVGSYFLLTSSNFSSRNFAFFQFFPFIFFYFSFESFFLFIAVIFFSFSVISDRFFQFICFIVFFFFFIVFVANFFLNFFLSLSRYNYIPSSYFFFPAPGWYQRFGAYRSNYYFKSWPTRFKLSIFYSLRAFNNSSVSKKTFQKSFFFTYVGVIKRRFLYYNKKTFFQVYGLKNLNFPVPVFGPNIFSSYSYYQDKINQYPIRAAPWDTQQEDTVLGGEEYQAADIYDETQLRDQLLERYVWPNKFSLIVPEDEDEEREFQLEADPNSIDPSYVTDSDNAVDVYTIGSPNISDAGVEVDEQSSFFAGKVNRAFFNKQKKPIQVSEVFLDSELEDIFDYDRVSQFEIYERDTLDQTFTSENSLGYWYSFNLSKSNKRNLPPTFISLHTRPLDPLFTTNTLFPFLLSLKSYSDFDHFPQFKVKSIIKCFKLFKGSITYPDYHNSFWFISLLVAIFFFPIRIFFSSLSLTRNAFSRKAFRKLRSIPFYYAFRKSFQINVRFNVSFSSFLLYVFFYFVFSFINFIRPSKFSSVIKQFSKSFILFYIFKNFKFLNALFQKKFFAFSW